MEKMEKNMENDMEAGVFYGCMGLKGQGYSESRFTVGKLRFTIWGASTCRGYQGLF